MGNFPAHVGLHKSRSLSDPAGLPDGGSGALSRRSRSNALAACSPKISLSQRSIRRAPTFYTASDLSPTHAWIGWDESIWPIGLTGFHSRCSVTP